MSTFRPFFYADERDGGPIINCVAATGVNLARAATNGAVPSTDVEVQALRKATGSATGGLTLVQMQKAMQDRYGFSGVRHSSWAAYDFSGPAWYASLGYIHSLPRRCWAQATDVFHCIAVTGSGAFVVIIDPLQLPRPVPQRLTVAEFKTFTGSGSFASVRVDEFSEVPHASVRCSRRESIFLYERSGTAWKRRRAFGRNFSGKCTLPDTLLVLGRSRRMVRMTSGAYAPGTWLDLGDSHVSYGGWS